MAFSDLRPILTIGHGHHDLRSFISLLRGAGAQVLVDVRVRPWNPFIPSFGKQRMKMDLLYEGIVYFFMGHRLGERPRDKSLLDEDGNVDYKAYEESKDFQDALDWLVERTREGTVCMMAGKVEPWDCHRHWLLAQALMARKLPVIHILGDGKLEPASPDLLHWQAAQGIMEGAKLLAAAQQEEEEAKAAEEKKAIERAQAAEEKRAAKPKKAAKAKAAKPAKAKKAAKAVKAAKTAKAAKTTKKKKKKE